MPACKFEEGLVAWPAQEVPSGWQPETEGRYPDETCPTIDEDQRCDRRPAVGRRGGCRLIRAARLLRLASRHVVEAALEAKTRDSLARRCYRRVAAPAEGNRNGYRCGRLKTAEQDSPGTEGNASIRSTVRIQATRLPGAV
jgi:hypothetical protein